MKTCYCCGLSKDPDQFGKNRSKPDGLGTECKSCKSLKDKEYRERNKEKIKVTKQTYYQQNRDTIIERVCQYAKDNRVKHRAWGSKARNKLKIEVLGLYSGGEPCCQGCHQKEICILTIDHIEGNGAQHRREIFGENSRGCGYRFYQWLKQNDYPDGFQVLCYNCQYRKRLLELKSVDATPLQENRAAYVKAIKVECLQNYGGCKCYCGEDDVRVLTLDHVNNDGANHRRESGTRGFNFYMMLRKLGFPKDPPLQVLCMNCNIKKERK